MDVKAHLPVQLRPLENYASLTKADLSRDCKEL